MEKTIFYLVKIFDELTYAEQFVGGKLFANSLSYFRRLEDSEANRGDSHEGVVTWIQPEKANLEIYGIPVPQGDLAGPISVKMNWHDSLNVFCIYAAHSGNFNTITSDNIADFRKHLEIPDECLKLGKHAVVITNVSEFVRRVQDTARENEFGFACSLVDYYDPSEFHGSFDQTEAVFKKRSEYSHQKEYRFAFNSFSNDRKPLIIDVGDLNDIATLCDVNTVNQLLEIKLESHAE
ncbi:hypothetical protein VXJ15_004292 [Vibrio vulnificus]|nr:hypothetical protein [Vibrio vulnificus]